MLDLMEMNEKAFAFVLVGMMALSIIAVCPAKASSGTIVVPDDYPTIAAAIGNATAGDVIFVRSGTYPEHMLVIDKSLSLMGEGADTTIISDIDQPPYPTFMPVGTDAIQINADNVKISKFTVSGATVDICHGGNGTQIVSNNLPDGVALYNHGLYQTVAQNTIGTGFECNVDHANITGNIISGLTNGHSLELLGSFNIVYANTVDNKMEPGYQCGIYVEGNGNLIAKNTITNSGDGVEIGEGSNNTVYANIITNSHAESLERSGAGLGLLTGYNNTFYANYLANNTYGAAIGGEQTYMSPVLTANNTVYHNDFVNNTHQVQTDYSVSGTNLWDNGREGNYWSDYQTKYPNATEVDASGIGDTPYVIDANRTDHYPLMAPFNISTAELPSPTPSPTSTASQKPTQSPEHVSTPAFPAEYIAVAVAAVVIIAVAAAVTLRKRGSKAQDTLHNS